MDFVRAILAKRRSEEFYLRFSKLSTVAWAMLLILVALLTQRVESVLNAAFDLRGLTSGALLGGLLLAVFWKKASSRPVILGMAVSVSVMILINWFFKEKVFWPWYTLIGTVVTVLITFSLGPLFAAYAGKGPVSETSEPVK